MTFFFSQLHFVFLDLSYEQLAVKMLRIVLILLILSTLIGSIDSFWCPCRDKSSNTTVTPLRMCIRRSSDSTLEIQAYSDSSKSIVVLSGPEMATSGCLVVFHLSKTRTPGRSVCPGSCNPIPEVHLDERLLADLASTDDQLRGAALTCSLTLGMVQRKHFNKVGDVLWSVALRRIAECSENDKGIPSNNTTSPLVRYSIPSRRKVKAVVMWMGTADNVGLIRSQAKVLDGVPEQSTVPTDNVIAWAATDDLYPCAEEATKCNAGTKQYNGLLPASAMNFMPVGWRCAQRRPLRSLSHVLALFNPQFVVLLDDDTYLNYKLLMRRFERLLLTTLVQQPVFLGEYQGRTGARGHLSTVGIFAGGSGYIIGQNLLLRLHQRAASFFGFENRTVVGAKLGSGGESGGGVLSVKQAMEVLAGQRSVDEWRSPEHRVYLSVLGEGLEHAYYGCGEPAAAAAPAVGSESGARLCVPQLKPLPYGDFVQSSGAGGKLKPSSQLPASLGDAEDLVVPLSVRLVDFCSLLMAGDNTCQHSDHSLGRCMIYGARALPLGVGCHSAVDLAADPKHSEVRIGMCFMTPQCNTSEQITCHRYRASSRLEAVPVLAGETVLSPERNNNKGGYYRHHSSVYDGKITDTF